MNSWSSLGVGRVRGLGRVKKKIIGLDFSTWAWLSTWSGQVDSFLNFRLKISTRARLPHLSGQIFLAGQVAHGQVWWSNTTPNSSMNILFVLG